MENLKRMPTERCEPTICAVAFGTSEGWRRWNDCSSSGEAESSYHHGCSVHLLSEGSAEQRSPLRCSQLLRRCCRSACCRSRCTASSGSTKKRIAGLEAGSSDYERNEAETADRAANLPRKYAITYSHCESMQFSKFIQIS